MKIKTIFIAFMLSSAIAFAQTPDTLIVNIDDYAQINISSIDIFTLHKRTTNLDNLYKSFYYDYLKSKAKIKSGEFVNVYHKIEDGISKIEIKKRTDIVDEFYVDNDNVKQNVSYPIKIHFLNHYPPFEKFTLLVKDEIYFSQIAKLSLDSIRKNASIYLMKGAKKRGFKRKRPKRIFKNKYSYKLMYANKGNSIDFENGIVKRKSNYNYIDVRPMVGLFSAWSELENFGPSVGLDIGLALNKKQFKRYRMGYVANFSVLGDNLNDSSRFDVVMQHSLYFAINNSRSITNEIKFGVSALTGEYGQGFGPFFQYNIKKIGFKVDMPMSTAELKEMINFNEQRQVLNLEDYCKYSLSFSVYYNF